jgi:hypothetical protein
LKAAGVTPVLDAVGADMVQSAKKAERGSFAMSEVVVQADVAGVSSVWMLMSSVSSQSSLIVLYRKVTGTIQIEAKRASGKGSDGEKRKSRNAGRRLTDQQ